MKESAEREALLVLRAQSGDREALDALLASVQEPLYRYVLSLARERHPAEEALQETFMRGYTVVVLGLVALGAHFSRGVARVFKASNC